MSIGVFISYKRVDKRIANELRTCLVALSGDIDAFIDHRIGAGEDYDQRISKEINASTWFIMINPGNASSEKDMGWCIYEAGQFRNRLSSEDMSEHEIAQRMCVIYDVDIPDPLSRYQAIRVQRCTLNDDALDLSADSSRIENTGVYQLFASILQGPMNGRPLRDLSEPAARQHVRDQARRFIKVFLNEQNDTKLAEVTLQPRVSLMLPARQTEASNGIDAAVEVTSCERALSDVFGIAGEKTTWGEIKSAFRLPSGADALWVQDVEDALVAITADKVPTQTNMLIHARNGALFRPVVTRYFPFVSKRREVFISFIQVPHKSLIPRESGSGSGKILPKQQVLLISLLFAFRFRQRVLPLAESAQAVTQNTERLTTQLSRIEREIMILENEAEEYGFDLSEEQMDHPQVAECISDEGEQAEVKDIVANWMIVRRDLVALLSDRRNPRTRTSAQDISGDVIRGLTGMSQPNKRFTEIVVRELAKSLNLFNRSSDAAHGPGDWFGSPAGARDPAPQSQAPQITIASVQCG